MTIISYEQPELWKSDCIFSPLEARLDSCKVVSFDIFDTVLFRACGEPADIFEQTALKAIEHKALHQPLNAKEFRSLRIAAERSARNKAVTARGHAEITLADIYEELPGSLLDRQTVLQLELDAEKEACYLNPNALSLLRYCKRSGRKIALVSDMYLSSLQIMDLLVSAGFDPQWADLLLVSSEHGCSKWDGGLYDVLLQAFPDIGPNQMLHIGDNLEADVKGAAGRGIPSVHYGVIPESFTSPYHWESVRHGAVLPQIKSVRKLASCTLPDRPLDEMSLAFYRFGAEIAGPFLNAVCEWAVDACVREGYKAIHPLMREAHILAPMLEQIIAKRGLDIRVYPVSISRQAAYLPSLQQFTEAELDYLMSQLWVKVKDLFEILGVEDEIGPYRSFAEHSIRDCNLITDEEDASIAGKLRTYLLSKPLLEKIHKAIETQRLLFIEYLQQSCGSEPCFVTLDLGFNGTIQKSLESILKLAGQPARTVHLLAAGTERIAELMHKGMDIRCYIGHLGPDEHISRRIARSPGMLEELMMGRFGSVKKYARGETDDAVIPLLFHLQLDEQDFQYKEACQLGMTMFQSCYSFFQRVKPDCVPDPNFERRQWSLPLHRTIDMPTPAEAGMLGSLTHQDNFCGTQIARICEPVDDRWFSRGGSHFLDVCNYGPSMFNAFWPQGLLTLKEPYYLYRYFLQARDQFGRQALIFDMMCRLKAAGFQTFNIYGAGDFADHIVRAAVLHGLQARGRVTPSSLQDAVSGDTHVYVTATLNDFSLYRTAIEQVYLQMRSELRPVILSFMD